MHVHQLFGYSTSKAAVIHFTKNLARKWAQYGIYDAVSEKNSFAQNWG